MRRRVTGAVTALAAVAVASGCSAATTTSPTVRPHPTTTTRAAAASTTRPTVAPTTTTTGPAPTTTTTTGPGAVSVAAGSRYTMRGSGCTPGAAVTVSLASSTHPTVTLATSPAGPIGSYAIPVTVPATGATEAVLRAECGSPSASGRTQQDVPIHITS